MQWLGAEAATLVVPLFRVHAVLLVAALVLPAFNVLVVFKLVVDTEMDCGCTRGWCAGISEKQDLALLY
jgi:hypothetical protein